MSTILIQMEDNGKNKNRLHIEFVKQKIEQKHTLTHKSQVSLGVGDGQRYISNIY